MHGRQRPQASEPYRQLVAGQLELKELRRRYDRAQELRQRLPLMRKRLQAILRNRESREEALMRMIEDREDQLREAKRRLEVHHQAPRIWPDLVNSEPLGQSLLKAIQEMRNLNSPPAEFAVPSWPSTILLADLWLACSEMETLRSFLSSSQPDEVEQLGPEISAKKNLMPIDDALDAAEDVAARFRPHRLLQLRSDHQKAQAELDLDTRACQKRLEMVLEAHGPLQRSLCIQKLKNCELQKQLAQKLEDLAGDEVSWQMQRKAKMVSEDHPMEKVRNFRPMSETYALRNILQEHCAESEKAFEAYKLAHARGLFSVNSARKEVEQTRQRVAALELAERRNGPNPKLVRINKECRAILNTVREQVKEAHTVLESFASWASKVESALVLCGVSEPPWCAIASMAPTTIVEDAKKLREILTKILQAVGVNPKAKPVAPPPVSSRKVRGRPQSARVVSTSEQVEEVTKSRARTTSDLKEVSKLDPWDV